MDLIGRVSVSCAMALASVSCSHACSRASPDDPPPAASIGLVEAPPGALGARAASAADAGLALEPPTSEESDLPMPAPDASVPL